VIGAGNSAAEAALELHRAGARVTLVHRGARPSRTLKYWVGPDLGNRIERGEIVARFLTEVTKIDATNVHLRHVKTGETDSIPNDYVFALTGYHADFDLMRRLGIRLDEETLKPALNPETFESNIPGLYLAGVMIAGVEANRVFIENGRFHGEKIVAALLEVAPPRSGAGPAG
jgi:thioredoxin reductase (NADPH)